MRSQIPAAAYDAKVTDALQVNEQGHCQEQCDDVVSAGQTRRHAERLMSLFNGYDPAEMNADDKPECSKSRTRRIERIPLLPAASLSQRSSWNTDVGNGPEFDSDDPEDGCDLSFESGAKHESLPWYKRPSPWW